MIYPSSLLIPLLALLPNLFFAAAGGARSADNAGSQRRTSSPTGTAAGLLGAGGASGAEPLPLVLLERVGQVGVFLSPILSPIQFTPGLDTAALIAMAVALGIYYACWTRYFLRGRDRKLLLKPFLGIPIPMAIAPVLYFLFAAEILRSPLLAAAAVLFAGGHIPITLIQLKVAGGGSGKDTTA